MIFLLFLPSHHVFAHDLYSSVAVAIQHGNALTVTPIAGCSYAELQAAEERIYRAHTTSSHAAAPHPPLHEVTPLSHLQTPLLCI